MDKQKRKIIEQVLSWSEEELAELLKIYDKKHYTQHKQDIAKLTASEMERKLLENGINSACPHCGSIAIRKRGRDSRNQRFQCNDCGKNFTCVTNTFLEKSNLNWKAWIRIVEMTINGYSLTQMINVLDSEPECEASGITKSSVLLARHKLLYAVSLIPQPILKGVIQIDEKHFRESQKGTMELVNYVPTIIEKRLPRYGRISSALGVMSAEFMTVPVAVDEEGYAVAKVACMGKLDIPIFVDLFYDHIKNASIICSDANKTYIKYCRQFNIVHYIKPAKYMEILAKEGYTFGRNKTPEQISKNFDICNRLYWIKQIDYIANKGHLTYKEFKAIKDQQRLSLARVNSFHNKITRLITVNKTGVSNKYLDKYIKFYTFIHNWSVSKGRPVSSSVDAEEILIYILKNTKNSSYTLEDLQNEELTIPKPTNRYHNMLAAMTSEARKEFNNKYLKFNEEDSVYDFKKRDYLMDCPDSWVREVARHHGIPYSKGVNKFNVVSKLLKLEDIEAVIAQLLLKEKKIHIEDEDSDILSYLGISESALTMDTPLHDRLGRRLPEIREDSPLYHPNIYPTVAQREEYEEQRIARKQERTCEELLDDNEE